MLRWLRNKHPKKEKESVMDDNLSLLSPWMVYVNRVKVLFAGDDEVTVKYDDESTTLSLLVDNHDKAEALSTLLPLSKEFGNVTLDINVVPCNSEQSEADLYRKAFKDNRVLFDVAEGYGPAGDIAYALFVPEIIQLREDDISQFDGLTTITYAELAKSVLELGDVRISSALL